MFPSRVPNSVGRGTHDHIAKKLRPVAAVEVRHECSPSRTPLNIGSVGIMSDAHLLSDVSFPTGRQPTWRCPNSSPFFTPTLTPSFSRLLARKKAAYHSASCPRSRDSISILGSKAQG